MDETPRMTVERLAEFGAAWRNKDVERLMSFMTDDCVFCASVGTEPGQTFHGRDEVRRGFELMLAYDAVAEGHDGTAFVTGDRGASQWSFRYESAGGEAVDVHGCDIYEFAGDRIRVKDAFRKVKGDIDRGTPAGRP